MTYPNAAAGLKTVYQAKLVGLISIVLVFFPIIQVFAAAALLVAGILTLISLYQCRKDDSGYRTAFALVIVQLVTNLLSRFIPSITGTIFLLATDVLGLASLYFVYTTTNRLLKTVGAEERITDRGVAVWRINVICTVIIMVCQLFQMIPNEALMIFAFVVTLIACIAQIVGDIMYILFPRDACRTLESHVPPEMHVDQIM